MIAWPLALLAATSTGSSALDLGGRAVEEFRVEDAIALLERARGEGPYAFDDHARLYELLGIAYAYDGRSEDASQAFVSMLGIEPTRMLRYTLSPKVTLPFEEARRRAERIGPPILEVIWPRDKSAAESIPIDVEVVADPFHALREARVFVRQSGAGEYRVHRVALKGLGTSARVVLDPPAPEIAAPIDLELYAIASDDHGNEVLRWASPERPRTIQLRYQASPEWYERWWTWTVGAGVLAAGTALVVYAAAHRPSDEIQVNGSVR